ncbi:MAG: hypothetical protein AAF703_17680 [Cyanobacteria bacterium P01_D01_bin.105]
MITMLRKQAILPLLLCPNSLLGAQSLSFVDSGLTFAIADTL